MLLKIILILFFVSFVAYYAFSAIMQDSTPLQPYKVMKTLGDVEIRYYPPAVTASVHKSGKYKKNLNDGFRDIAGYIFGGNESAEKIAMTAPVIAVPDSNGLELAFVMPEDFRMDKRPTPRNKDIAFRQTEPVYAAALRFGGRPGEEDMREQGQKLLNALKEAGLSPAGPVQHLYYNPPFKIFNRRNEVLVALENYPAAH